VHVQAVGLNAKTKNRSALSRRGHFSLDIPFYRTSAVCLFNRYLGQFSNNSAAQRCLIIQTRCTFAANGFKAIELGLFAILVFFWAATLLNCAFGFAESGLVAARHALLRHTSQISFDQQGRVRFREHSAALQYGILNELFHTLTFDLSPDMLICRRLRY